MYPVQRLVLCLAVCVAACSPAPQLHAADEFPAFTLGDRWFLLFGNLHAHSSLSDDVSDRIEGMAPKDAFQYAFENGIDFLAITDHHQSSDSPGNLRLTAEEYRRDLYDAAMEFNRAHPRRFVAIPGIEWGAIGTGNHLNLLGAKTVPPDDIGDREYEEMYVWALANAEFVQFNHPNSWRRDGDRRVGNFGEKRFSDSVSYVATADPVVKTLSVITTVRGGHISGEHRRSEAKTHREIEWENYYRRYLNLGFHLAPAANQDTHWRNFGTVTAARTAAWVHEPTYEGLMDAFRGHRVYATEDDESAVAFYVEYGGGTYWMGETVPLTNPSAQVDIRVEVWQAHGTNADPIDEGPYRVTMVRDTDGVGGREARPESFPFPHITGGAHWEVASSINVSAGQYLYVRVEEQNGRDNLVGDGEDTAGDAGGPDGLRDDRNDTAITAPVWFVHASRSAPATQSGATPVAQATPHAARGT